ncbi:MAG: ATP-binding cassette domain-containing protein, partial [Propionibacteriaceae bacterium]|nr:ATP-binding cassette domain-containing protein [Propionibacteriaceae bacterium]
MTAVLEVKGLVRHFEGVRAVDDVSFQVGAGEVVALIGPNGSGKSTTLNVISGVVPAQAGEIEVDGRPLTGLSPERVAARGVSRTFQNGRVFGALSVEDNVAVGLWPRLTAVRPWRRLAAWPVLGWAALLAETALALLPGPATRREARRADERVTAELARFGERLLPRRRQAAFTLSYANRRRTEIARALAPAPRLLLLDEPTAGMNQTETAEVLAQLQALKAAGQAMLLVEHKIDLVLALSDRVVVLDEGRIIAEGAPQAVRRDQRVIEAYLGRRAGAEPRPAAAESDGGAFYPADLGSAAAGGGSHAAGTGGTAAGGDFYTAEGGGAANGGNSRTAGVGGAADGGPLLQLDGVNVFYGPVHALSEVSLAVGRREIVCLLGGNASGKSTTMKTILGLAAPRSGEVWFDGRAVTGLPTPARIRAGLAAVPEARRVFAQMTVAENILTGAHTRRDRAGVAADLERQYDHFPKLAARRRQAAGTLSGGEQQMLAFARALMSRPRLILLDEPTMGLAPKFVDQVLEEITRLNRDLGLAVLMVEQQAELALGIADRGYVLAGGR